MRYFSVNVSSGNSEHIGTLIANDSEELNAKIKEACQEHFDADVEIPLLDIAHYLYGNSGTVEIKIDSTDETTDEIFICQTWLY